MSYKKFTIGKIIGTILVIIIGLGLSWGVFAGLTAIICKLIGKPFMLKIATALWLVFLILRSLFSNGGKK